MPIDVVTTAIAHIAHLVDSISSALNITLPHPLLPFESGECMISAQYDLTARAAVRSCCYSLAPATFVNMNIRTKYRDFDWTPLEEVLQPVDSTSREHNNAANPSRDVFGNQVNAAGGTNTNKNDKGEDGEEIGRYVPNPAFPAALMLLQANVVALSIRVGMKPERLWPPEALLLNLHELRCYCESQVPLNNLEANPNTLPASNEPNVVNTAEATTSARDASEKTSISNNMYASLPTVFTLDEIGEVAYRQREINVLRTLRDRCRAQKSEALQRTSSGQLAVEEDLQEYVRADFLAVEAAAYEGFDNQTSLSPLGKDYDWNIVSLQEDSTT